MTDENSGSKDEVIIGRESPEYVQAVGISISVLALVSSFVYTAMTLILIEVEEVGALLWQGTLLILFFSFSIFLFLTYMHLVRILVATGPGRYPRSVQISKLPQSRVLNLLELFAMLLWWISMPLMLFAKNLIYLASASLVLIIVSLPLSYLFILKPLQTRAHDLNREVKSEDGI